MAVARLDDEDAPTRALFIPDGTPGPSMVRVVPTDYSRGPWDHGLLHGGPVVGLAAWASEAAQGLPDDMICSRLTVELLRGVPKAELDVTASLVKAGRRTAVVDVAIVSADGLVARSTSQWVVRSDGWGEDASSVPARPDQVADPGGAEFVYPRPGFNCDAAEFRYAKGSNEESGPGLVWARLTSPLLAGSPTSPLVAVATLADLAAAAGYEISPTGTASINPDLTLQLNRYPVGPWIAIDARNHRALHATGFNEAHLYDDSGPFGRILQSLVETPAPPGVPVTES